MLTAAMGETLTDEERAIFSRLTGRDREPLQRVEEMAVVVGRRGGKSRSMATLATYIAGLCEHRDVLSPGERGVLLTLRPISGRRHRAGLRHGGLRRRPRSSQLIANRTADTLELRNGSPSRSGRLLSPAARPDLRCGDRRRGGVLALEESSANADTEILNAVRPGLATTGGPLIIASSPYARRGELWETYRRHFGADGDPLILVAQGASRDFNPSLSQSVVDRALERDRSGERRVPGPVP